MRWCAVLVLLLGASGCGGTGNQEQRTLRVFAAASLTEAFTELAERFESEHPGSTVQLSLGPSSGLAEQIAAGAPADVFAAASPTTMQTAVGADAVDEPVAFASNAAQIAVPPDNPADIRGLGDLDRAGVKVAVCQPQVPCGVVAAAALRLPGLRVRPVTEEVDVRAVLTKVRLGEVDAGIVYVTDVLAAGEAVRGIELPEGVEATTTYPIAPVSDSASPALARDFVELVRSPDGLAVLEDSGFGAP